MTDLLALNKMQIVFMVTSRGRHYCISHTHTSGLLEVIIQIKNVNTVVTRLSHEFIQLSLVWLCVSALNEKIKAFRKFARALFMPEPWAAVEKEMNVHRHEWPDDKNEKLPFLSFKHLFYCSSVWIQHNSFNTTLTSRGRPWWTEYHHIK